MFANPESPHARTNFTVWFEKERRLDKSAECIGTCRARHPRDGRARYPRTFRLRSTQTGHTSQGQVA